LWSATAKAARGSSCEFKSSVGRWRRAGPRAADRRRRKRTLAARCSAWRQLVKREGKARRPDKCELQALRQQAEPGSRLETATGRSARRGWLTAGQGGSLCSATAKAARGGSCKFKTLGEVEASRNEKLPAGAGHSARWEHTSAPGDTSSTKASVAGPEDLKMRR